MLPRKLPTILYWRAGMRADEEPIEINRFDLLNKSEDETLDKEALLKSVREMMK